MRLMITRIAVLATMMLSLGSVTARATPVIDDHFTGASGGVPANWSVFSGDPGDFVESGTIVSIANAGIIIHDTTVDPSGGVTMTVAIDGVTNDATTGAILVDFGLSAGFIVGIDATGVLKANTFTEQFSPGTVPGYAGGPICLRVVMTATFFSISADAFAFHSGSILYSTAYTSFTLDSLGTNVQVALENDAPGGGGGTPGTVSFDRMVIDETNVPAGFVLLDDHFTGNSGGVPADWSVFIGDSTDFIESGTLVNLVDDGVMIHDQTIDPSGGVTITVDIDGITGESTASTAMADPGVTEAFIVGIDASGRLKANTLTEQFEPDTVQGYSGGPVRLTIVMTDSTFSISTDTPAFATGAILYSKAYTSFTLASLGNDVLVALENDIPGGGGGVLDTVRFDRYVIESHDDTRIVSIDDVAAAEGSDLTFTISVSNPPNQEVTVDYETSDGTATTANGDYVAATGTATIAALASSTTVTVTVNEDGTNESDETLTVTLSAPVNATLGDAIGQGTIQDNDGAPTLSINDVAEVEGDAGTTAFVFTVSLSNASSQDVTVDFTTNDGTATAGSDYVAATGTVTIVAKTLSANISIDVNGDTEVEGDEAFTVDLSNAVGATIGDDSGLGTIQYDDGVVGIGDDSVSEFAIAAVAPNPSVGLTQIVYTVAREARVHLSVVDLQGRVVAVLVDGLQPVGRHQAMWRGTTERGLAAAGVYFVSYQVPGKTMTRRIVLTR